MAVPFNERVPVGAALILLRGVGEWEDLARHLGISDREIKLVRSLVGTIETKMMVLMSRWVQNDPKATWEKLGEALLKMNPPYEDKAAFIKQRFCPNLQLQQLGMSGCLNVIQIRPYCQFDFLFCFLDKRKLETDPGGRH